MKIKDYLAKKKKRQSDLIKEVGCSAGAMSLWITGQRTPSPEMARKIVKATRGQVSYADLYAEAEA